MAAEVVIPKGQDFLTTIRSDQYIELTPELLGPKMELFSETVTLIGIPLNPAMGNADTVMERLADGKAGEEVPTRLLAFANVSAAPVRLKGESPLAGHYDLYVTLSPTRESPGTSVYKHSEKDGGTFESKATFWPVFELRPLGGGHSIVIDTGTMKVPGFPMNIGSAGGKWSFRPPFANAVRAFRAKPFFYHGEIEITAMRTGQTSALVPLKFGGPTIAACLKMQAEFLQPGQVAVKGRMNFGQAKEFANLELEP